MTRKQALEHIKIAASKGDMQTATRIYCENRISRAAFDKAVTLGQQLAQGAKQ